MSKSNDAEIALVARYRDQRDLHAFNAIYLGHRDAVRRALGRRLGGLSEAVVEEFTQDFWARLPELIERWDPERGSLRTFLVVQATWSARSAEAKRRRRHASRRAALLPQRGEDPGAARCISAFSLENADGPEERLGGAGARKANMTEAIRAYLRDSTDRPAQVLRAHVEGRTGRDIAEELGVHPAQVSRDLARARKVLAMQLGPVGALAAG
ncbi:MAG: sigma-70 family RNA polymerase sigma factor [Alphaproteobacteria bacterium]|nr:sigma-70 family RNA polymerase sigma factor [Alphaproteobacteria bacterium]